MYNHCSEKRLENETKQKKTSNVKSKCCSFSSSFLMISILISNVIFAYKLFLGTVIPVPYLSLKHHVIYHTLVME